MVKAFEALDDEQHNALAEGIIGLLESLHQGGPGLAVPSAYAEVVIMLRPGG